jgi:ribonuclease HII
VSGSRSIAGICGEYFRLALLRGLEEALERAGLVPVAGVDEAGRGCLAGPVVAAAVVPGEAPPLPGIDDSKQLRPEARERLAAAIRLRCAAWSVAAVPAGTIDRVGILAATRLAMLAAVNRLSARPGALVIDAVRLDGVGVPCLALVKGDALSYAVACASILAKVERDRRMVELDRDLPHYGFARHKGYGSSDHLAALARFGPSPVHRLSFAPVVPRREAA